MSEVLNGRLSAAPLKFIAVSATAVGEYARPLDSAGRPRPESYVFAKGHFFGGDKADAGLSRVTFDELTKTLAVNLAKQNYFPTKDVPSADLLLVVHWGVTQVYRDPMENYEAGRINEAFDEYRNAAAGNDGNADPGAMNAALSDRHNSQMSVQGSIARNAALLGYKSLLKKEQFKIFASAEEQTMNEELNEERYFVIMMAYDYQYSQKEHKSRLLWITRISVRSPGNNFIEALPALAFAGAGVYGRHVDGLVRVNAPDRQGQVELGELKVLGEAEHTPATEPNK